MDASFREGGLGELIAEIAEMTMAVTIPVPGGGGIALPSYPWSPDVIEGMAEGERKVYLERLRAQRKHLMGK